ncbi:MAG: M16 family metallopeptidase [Thermoanaerobaculia bacterium]
MIAPGDGAALEDAAGEGRGSGGPRVALRFRRLPGARAVAVRAWLAAGGRSESIPGLALLTGRALVEGTRRRDFRRIADEAEALGMALASSASFEAHGVTADARVAHWSEALDAALEVLFEPSFPEERCRWLARQTAAELESLADLPEVRTGWAFLEHLHGPGHPLGRPLQGTPEGLAAIDSAACGAFHARAAGLGAIVTVAGDLEEEAVARRLEALAGGPATDGAPAAASTIASTTPPPERRREVALPPGDQAHLYAGRLTVPRTHPDRHALELLGVILGAGAGLTGRLPERVREREGLAYSVQVQTLAGAGLDAGRLVVYAGTSLGTVERAEAAVVEELARLVEEGVSAEEVAEARSYLLGRDPFRRETARQWAELLGEAALYGVPEDDPEWRRRELQALDAGAVTGAARRHLDPAELRVTVGLPRSV